MPLKLDLGGTEVWKGDSTHLRLALQQNVDKRAQASINCLKMRKWAILIFKWQREERVTVEITVNIVPCCNRW